MLVPMDLPILVPIVLPIASPMLVPAVVMELSKTPPDPAEAPVALAGGTGAAELFAGAAGAAGDAGIAGAAGDLLEDVRSTVLSAAEPVLLDPNVGNDGREPMRLENEFAALPVPAPDPLVMLLIEGKEGKVGNMLAVNLPLELDLELELPPHPGRVEASSRPRTTFKM
jgi:hypothetical protein